MRADKLILQKPTVAQLLEQITPFVIDEEHERDFLKRYIVRRRVAGEIVRLASKRRLTTSDLVELLRANDQTLNALLSLLGISQEEFYRHVTLARLEERKLEPPTSEAFHEWKMDRIIREILADGEFADAVFSLLLGGHGDRRLSGRVPPFVLVGVPWNRPV
ncbi:MAG: hypothetical protein HYS13_20855 [Planctomycetia bacterium]|nr:hypothetical protein [Planctomycetia bacterium]